MSSTPLLSIGLFVYNGERFLDETLRSILAQTFTDFELIISDNASTDRTGEICQGFAAQDDRIRYYRNEKNMGAGWNLRRVYELATAKYFKWAAADDLLEPQFFERCIDALERDPACVLAYSKTGVIDENGNFLENYVTPIAADSSDPVDRFRAMLLPLHWCYQIFGVMRLSALRQLPPQGSYVNSDGVLLSQMALLGPFYEVPEHLFVSRRHGEQSSRTLPVRVKRRRFRLTNRYPTLPAPEWWDPAKARTISFPEFRQLREFFLSIIRSPLSAGQKLRCYLLLLRWVKIHGRRIVKDFVVAADQILYNFQISKASSTFEQDVGAAQK